MLLVNRSVFRWQPREHMHPPAASTACIFMTCLSCRSIGAPNKSNYTLQQPPTEVCYCLTPSLHVQLPLALEHTAHRKEALHALMDLLTKSSPKAAVDAPYLQQALSCLTATEVTQLLDWPEVVKVPMTAPWWALSHLLPTCLSTCPSGL